MVSGLVLAPSTDFGPNIGDCGPFWGVIGGNGASSGFLNTPLGVFKF